MQFYSRDDMRYSVKWTKIVHQITYFLSIFFFFIKLSIKRLARLWFFFFFFLFYFCFCSANNSNFLMGNVYVFVFEVG